MLRLENVATPLTAATEVVPDKVPPLGFVPMAIVMEVAALVTVLPWASWMVTCIAGVIAAPAPTFVGCTVKASFDAVPLVTLKAVLVAPVRPAAAATRVYPVPVLLMPRLEKVATPFTAATVVVPDNAPPPGFVPMTILTE